MPRSCGFIKNLRLPLTQPGRVAIGGQIWWTQNNNGGSTARFQYVRGGGRRGGGCVNLALRVDCGQGFMRGLCPNCLWRWDSGLEGWSEGKVRTPGVRRKQLRGVATVISQASRNRLRCWGGRSRRHFSRRRNPCWRGDGDAWWRRSYRLLNGLNPG